MYEIGKVNGYNSRQTCKREADGRISVAVTPAYGLTPTYIRQTNPHVFRAILVFSCDLISLF